MKTQTEQIAATRTTRASLTSRAITEIKEQVQLDRWQKQIEERQLAGLSIAAYASSKGSARPRITTD